MNETTESTVLDIIEAARDLVAAGWPELAYYGSYRPLARDLYGDVTDDTDPAAVAWSITGAVHAAAHDAEATDLYYNTIGVLDDLVPDYNLSTWEDDPERTQADALALLDAAAERIAKRTS